MRNIVIAIDGTSASGKGFISKSISKLLGFQSLDTGALYRACTLRILEKFFYKNIIFDIINKNNDERRLIYNH